MMVFYPHLILYCYILSEFQVLFSKDIEVQTLGKQDTSVAM